MNEPVRETAAPEDRIQITIEQATTDVTVLKLAGDLDLLTAGVLHDRLWPHLERSASTIVLDFTQVGFLGSAGLAELVAANDTATRGGMRLILVATSRTVLRPLEITGLRSVFQVCESLEAALAQV